MFEQQLRSESASQDNSLATQTKVIKTISTQTSQTSIAQVVKSGIQSAPSTNVNHSKPSGDVPRALRKRIKHERRSKSADYKRRRRSSFHESIPKSKDDLDFGVYTLLTKPRNPWVNDLTRNKSLPNLSAKTPDTLDTIPKKLNDDSLSKSKSTPDLTKYKNKDGITKLERKTSSHNIYIKAVPHSEEPLPSQTVTVNIKSSETSLERKEYKLSKLDIGQLGRTQSDPNIVARQISLNKNNTESELLESQTKAISQAKELKQNCDDLIDTVTKTQHSINANKIVNKENIGITETVVKKIYQNAEHTAKGELNEHYSHGTTTKRKIVLQFLSVDYGNDFFEKGIEILRDFLKQLIFEDKIQNIVKIKKYIDCAEIKYNSEDESMYRKELNASGLGIERHSSMPEMTRDEFLEKKEEMWNTGLQRNNSLSSSSPNVKRRVLKTKVSSRLLQRTAASQGKQKPIIPYVPPAKRADPTWTDRPLKNVDSGYTTQAFIKYQDLQPPRSLSPSYNDVEDHHEQYEWGQKSYDVSSDEKSRPSSGQYHRQREEKEHHVDQNNNTPNAEKKNIINQINTFSQRSFTTSSDDDEDIRKIRTGYYAPGPTQDRENIFYEPFTTFAKQGTVFSTVSTTSVHDSNTFKYVYTIDAELSYREYNKLMKIINMLQEQKRKWEEEVQEVRDKLEKTGKEKMQLAHNNHILRQSLEAANKAIKEINGKVQELKQTLVPLREENSNLREENNEFKTKVKMSQNDKLNLVNEVQEYKNMKLVYEEKLSYKDMEIDEYKKNMHDKFRKLEEAYRHYRDDMEQKHQLLISEVEELRQQNENLKRELEGLKKENGKLKEEIQDLQNKNDQLELGLRQQKSVDDQLFMEGREKQMLTQNAQEMEVTYMKEIEKVSKEIEHTRAEIEKYKDESRALEGENDQLKFDLENLENKIKDLENTNELKESARIVEGQQNEILKNEVEELKKELRDYGKLKQEKVIINKEKQRFKDQMDILQNQLMEFESLKRESFIQQHENQRLKSEVERLNDGLQEMGNIKRQNASETTENERLNSELHHLRKQLSLLEDKQKFINSPYNDEIKTELENIRNQMKDLADKNQERKVEIYTDELKGELESLKNQIKDLDQINRKQVPVMQHHQPNVIIRESSKNTVITSEKEKISEKIIYIKDENGNIRELKTAELDSGTRKEEVRIDEDLVKSEKEIEVESAVPISSQSKEESSPRQERSQDTIDEVTKENEQRGGDNNRLTRPNSIGALNNQFVLKSTEISRREREKSTDRGENYNSVNWLPGDISCSDGENRPHNQDRGEREGRIVNRNEEEAKLRKLKQKQIEDRIRRKREKGSEWSLKTPDIHKLTRQSMEDLNDLYDTDGDSRGRRRNRSQSDSRRSKSADPRVYRSVERPTLAPEKPTRRERGRSPQRRSREYTEYSERHVRHRSIQNEEKSELMQQFSQNPQKYAVEVKVDNRNVSVERQNEITHSWSNKNKTSSVDTGRDERSPQRRKRVTSEERRSMERRRKQNEGEERDSSSDVDEKKPRRKQSRSREGNRRNENFQSADFLSEAMRSRQEQAIVNKLGNALPATFTDSTHKAHNGYLVSQQQHHPHQQQQYHQIQQQQQQQQQQKQQQQQQLLQKQHQQEVHQTTASTQQYQINTHVESNGVQRSNTISTNRAIPPMKPKRLHHEIDRGYQTDSPKLARTKEHMTASQSYSMLNDNIASATATDSRYGNVSSQQQVQNIRSDQSLKLTLTPSVNRRKEENLYATIEKKRISSSQKNVNNIEREQMEKRMEIARQKSLQKTDHAQKESEKLSDSDKSVQSQKSQTSMRGVITVDGVPIKRSRSSQDNWGYESEPSSVNRGGNYPQNNFITEQEADVMFNRAIKQASTSVTYDKRRDVQIRNIHASRGASDHVRTASLGHRQQGTRRALDVNKDEQRSLEHANTLPRNMKPLQQSIHSQISKAERHHRSANVASHETSEKQNNRSYRDMKLHDNIQRRQVSSQQRDASKRLSTMSNDSLGGFSQITFTTVSGTSYGPRYDDYATQIDDGVDPQQRKHAKSNGSASMKGDKQWQGYDESEILKQAKHIPKGHSKFHCEKCRKLNWRKTKGEPIRYCWERYFPISETTPVPSLQNLNKV